MTGQFRGLLLGARRRPRLLALLAALLALAGVLGYLGRGPLWRHLQRRAVLQALSRRDFAGAGARLARCLESWPGDAEWHLLAARAARCAGDHEEAGRSLDRCARLGGDRAGIALERALLVAQTGDPAPVEGYLRSLLRKKPAEEDLILEALAQGYLHAQRLPEALHCLDRWLEHQPDNVEALLLRGQVLESWNDPEEAIASFRRAVAVDGEDEQARRRLALALVRADRANEAIEHLEVLRRQCTDAEVLLGLARSRRSLGQVAQARRLLDEVLALQPRNAEALSERGKLALQTGRAAEAEGPLRQALALAPYDRETNYTWYLCLRQLGRAAEAARALETVQRIRADRQRVSELRRKVAASPREASLRCEVGLIFLRNGQTREGLRWLHSALQLDPGHAEARQALARYTRPKEQRP
jgi:tetratricopeptide (TPR) repeat protein